MDWNGLGALSPMDIFIAFDSSIPSVKLPILIVAFEIAYMKYKCGNKICHACSTPMAHQM